MYKLAAVFTMWLAFFQTWTSSQEDIAECTRLCRMQPQDTEMQRQEVIVLEREAAHAIQLGDGTFFRRVYSDDFSGTLSHGEPVTKTGLVNAVQSTAVKYEAFNASDIKVHIYRDTAVATCLWSARANVRGQSVNSQMRVMHIYVNGGSGWKVVAAQASALPPYTQQSL